MKIMGSGSEVLDSEMKYSTDRLERRHRQFSKMFDQPCSGFFGEFADFNKAYTLLSRYDSNNSDRRDGRV
jgi:hypothetical protein